MSAHKDIHDIIKDDDMAIADRSWRHDISLIHFAVVDINETCLA